MTGVAFPLPDPDWEPTAPFWAAAAEGRLSLPRCGACDRLVWYPADTCGRCGAPDPAWVDLSGRGTLFSWTVVHQRFVPQYEPPFVVGLVAVAEDPAARVVGRVVDAEATGLRVDQDVEVVFGPLRYPGVDATVDAPSWRPAAAP